MSDPSTDQAPSGGVDTSPAEIRVDAPQQPQAADVDAGASPAPDVQSTDALLDVVNQTLEQDAGPDASNREAPKDGQQAKPGDKPKGDAQQAKPRDVPPPFANHPRWKEQQQKLKDETTARTKAESRIKELEAPAQQYQQLSKALGDAGVDKEQLGRGVYVMMLRNTNPRKALELMQQEVALLQKELGETLDDDLVQAVEAGEITEERAREFSRVRAQTRQSEAEKATREADAKRQADQQAIDARTKMIETSWHQRAKAWRERDPDFEAKSGLIQAMLHRVVNESGRPQNPEQAHKLFDRAYELASQERARHVPRRPQVKSLPSGGRVPTRIANQPQSAMDVLNATLEEMAAGG